MKHFYTISILSFWLSLGFWSYGQAGNKPQSESGQIQVMLLGVYHFDNPGRDKHNLEIDDYFTVKRQREINEVVSLLSQFGPDKIFIEQKPVAQGRIDSLYEIYANNQLDLKALKGGRNEIYQLGFKVAKQLGLRRLDCIDAEGYWLGPYADFIADTLSLAFYNADEERQEAGSNSANNQFRTQTVKQNLVLTNQWKSIRDNHSYYTDVAIRVKDTIGIYFTYQENTQVIDDKEYMMRSFDFNNIGVELVAEWYKRNFFIYRNILEKTENGDKVLVIFGQGHIPILHHLLESNSKYKLVSPLSYLTD